MQTYFKLLPPQEQKNANAFITGPAFNDLITARYGIRKILSSYYPEMTAREWNFSSNSFGKPFVSNPQIPASLQFNISHTKTLVAFAVTWDRQIGIDIEETSKKFSFSEIAKEVFCPSEQEQLLSISESEQSLYFFKIWTLKEAYIKAKGFGLSLPLTKIEIILNKSKDRLNSGNIKVNFLDGYEDSAKNWTFLSTRPSPSIQLGVAASSLLDEKIKFIEKGVLD